MLVRDDRVLARSDVLPDETTVDAAIEPDATPVDLPDGTRLLAGRRACHFRATLVLVGHDADDDVYLWRRVGDGMVFPMRPWAMDALMAQGHAGTRIRTSWTVIRNGNMFSLVTGKTQWPESEPESEPKSETDDDAPGQ